MKCLVSIAIFSFCIMPMLSAADIVWSGTQYQRAYHDLPALDFNQDGTDDFMLNEVVKDYPDASFWEIWVEPADGQVLADKSYRIGIPLGATTIIFDSLENPDHIWANDQTYLFDCASLGGQSLSYGGFFADNEGYLGLSFNVEGSTHYGWIEMSHDKDRPFPENNSLMIHGWAWETEANTAIIAGAIPEPSSGILTMVGSLTLLQLARSRRRKQMHPSLPSSHPQFFKAPEKW